MKILMKCEKNDTSVLEKVTFYCKILFPWKCEEIVNEKCRWKFEIFDSIQKKLFIKNSILVKCSKLMNKYRSWMLWWKY